MTVVEGGVERRPQSIHVHNFLHVLAQLRGQRCDDFEVVSLMISVIVILRGSGSCSCVYMCDASVLRDNVS